MIVFGMGGIGLNIVQGARIAGAGMIVGVDTNPAKEALARKLGATHFVNPKTVGEGLVGHLNELTGGGADYTFEAVGQVDLMRQAFDCTKLGWGICTVVGMSPSGQAMQLLPMDLLLGRKLQGTAMGGAKCRSDLPRFVDHLMEKQFDLESLITHKLPLDRINDGFEMMKRGESIRSVVVF